VKDTRAIATELRRTDLLLRAGTLALAASFALGVGATQAQDADDIDGTWTLDTSIGSFDDYSSAWVGFRVSEVLNPGGAFDAVGRTPVVSGRLEASGTTIESAVIEADLTAIVSDKPRRDGAIQRSLGTTEFPTATFVSTEPVDLGSLPGDDIFTASMQGTLTIRDVSQHVTLDLTAQRVGETVAVVGELPIDFTSFGVTMPTAPIVVSVEDAGDLQWKLFFTRDADDEMNADDGMADDEMAADDGMAAEDTGTEE